MPGVMVKKKFLISFDTKNTPYIQTVILIIASGVAGLRAAIEAAKYAKVLIITKDKPRENNTERAQGGIAVVLSEGDSFERHIEDTLRVGSGLCNDKVVTILVEEGPLRIQELIQWGANFDKDDGRLSFTQEAGHSMRRIIHAKGDATGGIGQIYRETTNSIVATGCGMALAYRAGAQLTDMEFVQFHPTTLYVAGASRTLISETVRGEGAILKNKYGERFMFKYHPEGELAPRDVASRAILREMKQTNDTHVYLDLTHLGSQFLKNRFPNIMETCSSFGIDIKKDLIPVRPTAHYMIGGIKIDTNGSTNIINLYACGETACSGLHGANRLASNSLLEGLVFGCRTGCSAGKSMKDGEKTKAIPEIKSILDYGNSKELGIEDLKASLKNLMSRCAGIERDEKTLLEAEEKIDFWSSYVMKKEFSNSQGWELQNMLLTAKLIQKAALTRKESRGVHYRKDYPKQNDVEWLKAHTELSKEIDCRITKL